jgi:hypothetical protein
MSLVLAVVSADIEAALAPVDVCIAVNLVPKDSVALTFAVAVSSTNASPAPLVAPSSDRVVVIAVSPAILWLDSLVNKVSKPVPENDPARMSLIAEALAVASARILVANPLVIEVADAALATIVAVRPLAVDKMSSARPLVTEVILAALSVIDVARPSVTEVILAALSVIVVARPSVTEVILAALATMAAAEVASLVSMAAVVLALTLVPPLSANVLVVSAASF